MDTILTRLTLIGTLFSTACGPSEACEPYADDDCILEACTTCEDECGRPCDVLESYPPQFDCPTRDVYVTVAEVCDDWTPAE